VWKETELVRGRGHLEPNVFLYSTPQALTAEGIAQLAVELALATDVVSECLGRLGIGWDADIARAAWELKTTMQPLRTNIALAMDEDGMTRDETWGYARAWLLEPDDYVTFLVDGVFGAAWPPYLACYDLGLRLCRAAVNGDTSRFEKLLREQISTPDLLEMARA
jgi:hypothetical protein